jgi:hypothetical protein
LPDRAGSREFLLDAGVTAASPTDPCHLFLMLKDLKGLLS